MAGHSHAKNVMFRKSKSDQVRSKMFSKLAREITVAAKLGTPDPSMNSRLRLAGPLPPIGEAVRKGEAVIKFPGHFCVQAALVRRHKIAGRC